MYVCINMYICMYVYIYLYMTLRAAEAWATYTWRRVMLEWPRSLSNLGQLEWPIYKNLLTHQGGWASGWQHLLARLFVFVFPLACPAAGPERQKKKWGTKKESLSLSWDKDSFENRAETRTLFSLFVRETELRQGLYINIKACSQRRHILVACERAFI